MSNTRLGLVRCEHCGRQFNPHSGARHIPWCAKQQSENRKHKLSADKRQALERYKWRISYRPSNQINVNRVNNNNNNNQNNQLQQKHSQRPTNRLAELSERLKKSSLNSSTTLSSPSNSSTNSIGTGSIISGFCGNESIQRTTRGDRSSNQSGGVTTKQLPVSALKRSISSLTLTKQTGVSTSCVDSVSGKSSQSSKSSSWRKPGELGGKVQNSRTEQFRAKSFNDLNAQHMDEIVELLTKRMDEIYAQNQKLLASLSADRSNSINLLQLTDERATTNTDSIAGGSGNFDEQASDNQVMCHHCKAYCIDDANYCHKCGCKVRATTSSSSPVL